MAEQGNAASTDRTQAVILNERKTMTEVLRLPLWKNVLDQLCFSGIDYGMEIKSAWLEDQLKCERESMEFQISVSKIRQELEKKGFYLNGRDCEGDFEIIRPEDNVNVMQRYQSQALNLIRRSSVLGSATRMDLLDDAQRQKHETVLRTAQTRMVLMARTKSFVKLAEKHDPKLMA